MGTFATEHEAGYSRDRLFDLLKVTKPPAGQDWSARVPGGEIWHVLSVSAVFVASATVANRFALLDFVDADASTITRAPPPAAITAGVTAGLFWYPGAVLATPVSWLFTAPIPRGFLPLFPGMAIAASANGLQAGDQWQSIVIYREITRLRGKGAELRYERERMRERHELEAAAGAPRG